MSAPAPPETLGPALDKPKDAQWAEPLRVTTRMVYRDDGKGDREAGYDHVFVVSADGGSPRQITTGEFDDLGPVSWTPDGGALVFGSRRGKAWEREAYRSGVYRVSVAGGEATRLTTQEGPTTSAAISPDGRLIAFTGFDDAKKRGYENRRLYVMDADGKNLRTLAGGLDRSLDHPTWSPDGRALYADYADRGVTKVARVDLSGGGLKTVAEGLAGAGLDLPYSGGGYSVGERRDRGVHRRARPTTPPIWPSPAAAR